MSANNDGVPSNAIRRFVAWCHDGDVDRCVCNIADVCIQSDIHIMYLYIQYIYIMHIVHNDAVMPSDGIIRPPEHKNVKFNDFMLSRARRPEKCTRSGGEVYTLIYAFSDDSLSMITSAR